MLDAEKVYEDLTNRPLKILIMVLSFKEEPYLSLMNAQKETWASVNEEGVYVVFYYGGCSEDVILKTSFVNNRSISHVWDLGFNCTDDYYLMSKKFQLALEGVLKSDFDFNYIFRTNSSSYVNQKRLKEFAATLPTEKLYAGWTMVDSNFDGGLVVSGSGIWLSRDTAEILRDQINIEEEREEDILIGRVLRKNGIVAVDDKTRYDVPEIVPEDMPTDRIHYRFKCGARREVDSANMRIAHQKIISQ